MYFSHEDATPYDSLTHNTMACIQTIWQCLEMMDNPPWIPFDILIRHIRQTFFYTGLKKFSTPLRSIKRVKKFSSNTRRTFTNPFFFFISFKAYADAQFHNLTSTSTRTFLPPEWRMFFFFKFRIKNVHQVGTMNLSSFEADSCEYLNFCYYIWL